MTVQEARLSVAMGDLQKAQAQLDEKEAELAKVRAMYEQAMREKQVSFSISLKNGTKYYSKQTHAIDSCLTFILWCCRPCWMMQRHVVGR